MVLDFDENTKITMRGDGVLQIHGECWTKLEALFPYSEIPAIDESVDEKREYVLVREHGKLERFEEMTEAEAHNRNAKLRWAFKADRWIVVCDEEEVL